MSQPIHQLSHASPLSEFDLFSVPFTQATVEKDLVTEHRPISSLEGASVIQFDVLTPIDEYLRLDDTDLYFKLKITSLTTGKPTWGNVKPVKYMLHAMIKQIDVFIGDKQVTTSPTNYPYKAYLETLLGFTKGAKEGHLTSAYWYDSTAPSITNNTSFELKGKLHWDFAFQDRVLIGGCRLRIDLHLHKPEFYLISSEEWTPKVEIQEAILTTHRSKVYPAIVHAHNLALEKAPVKIPIAHRRLKAFNIAKGELSYHADNIHTGQMPRRVGMMLLPTEEFLGTLKSDPFKFAHNDVTEIVTFYNGSQVPSRPYQPNFTDSLYLREYFDFLTAINQVGQDPSVSISRSDWPGSYCLYFFNYSPDLSMGCNASGYTSLQEHGTLRASIKFKGALTKPLTLLVFCEFDKIIEIDKSRNAKIEFN